MLNLLAISILSVISFVIDLQGLAPLFAVFFIHSVE